MEGFGIYYFPYAGYVFGEFKRGKVHGRALVSLPGQIQYNGKWAYG